MKNYLIPILIALANSISELSNHGKLKSSFGWGKWFDEKSWKNKDTWGFIWQY